MNKNNGKRDVVAGSQVLPDFCQAGVFFIAVLGGELLALVLALAAVDHPESFWSALAMISMLVQWVVMGVSVMFCLMRGWLSRLEARKALGFAYLVIILVSLVLGYGAALLSELLGLYAVVAVTEPGWFYIKLLAIAGITAAVLLRYLYVQQQWRSQVQAEALARVEALQARIRPHFLFNSLNTISSLVRARPGDAERAIGSLAGLFRASLKVEAFCPLIDEIELTRDYLSLEHLRLGDRLRVTWDIDERVDMNHSMPALSIQPLVENAVYHGVEPRIEGGEIRIALSPEADAVRLTITNPLPQQGGDHEGNQMALENIRQRLELSYGHAASLRAGAVDSNMNYEVKMVVPKERAES